MTIERWIERLACPDCGSDLTLTDRTLSCRNETCSYRTAADTDYLNLLPTELDSFQKAENDFRVLQNDGFLNPFAHLPEPAQRRLDHMQALSDYEWSAQFQFFISDFTSRYSLSGRGIELGGATCHLSGFIKTVYPSVEMIATDVAPINIRRARALSEFLGFDTDLFALADASHLPFKAGSFDFIVTSGMLHHIGDLPRALRMGYDALKPGGRWYALNELSIGSLPRIYWNSRFGAKGKWARQAGIHEYSYTYKEWLKLFREAGFDVVDILFHRNPRHKLKTWKLSAYYAFISKLPAFMLRLGVPCEINFVLEKR
ncbi:MAG: class I SAM-dependent methyltransferase [Planctomycetota bacterium]